MMGYSIKDHPFYQRMKVVSAAQAASWILGDIPVENADKAKRKEAFRRVAKSITSGKSERAKHGFNSDTNGEIARAMEWALQAGLKAGAKTTRTFR